MESARPVCLEAMEPEHTEIDLSLDVLERYVAGECTAPERAALDAYMAREPLAARVVAELKAHMLFGVASQTPWDASAAWNEFQRVIEAERTERETSHVAARTVMHETVMHETDRETQSTTGRVGTTRDSRQPSKHLGKHLSKHLGVHPRLAATRPWLGRVVGAAVIAVVGVVFITLSHRPSRVSAGHTYRTVAGQRAELTLVEDIHVVLAPNSTLHMRGNTGTLSGEAFFTVPHRTKQPLTILTGRVATRVLGTMFDVRRYPNESVTRVLVVSGRVSTGNAQTGNTHTGNAHTVTVDAHMMALVTDSSATTASVADMTRATGWTSGMLTFRDARVADVLAAVGRWYDIRFTLSDSTMAGRLLTATLDTRHTRSETLAALESVLQVRMTFVGDTIVLSPSDSIHHAPLRRSTRESFTSTREMGR